jgi:poly-gamma-glutamate synthesis protein (capsule biosynthesis protein)
MRGPHQSSGLKTGKGTLRLFVLSGCLLLLVSGSFTGRAGADEIDGVTPVSSRSPLETGKTAVHKAGRRPLLLSFTGDVMAHTINFTMPDYSMIYDGVREVLQADDLTFANLEFPVYPDKPMSSYPLFNVHPPYVEAAIDAGMDVFSMANNHTTDKGPEGVKATFDVMSRFAEERGIYFSGIRRDPKTPFTPVSIEIKGWRIGFLAMAAWLNGYWGGEHAHYVHYDEKDVKKEFLDLIRAEAPGYDIFILSYHGGVEYSPLPSDVKAAFFDECLDAGADIVWAHHPHVLQPWYADLERDGGKAIFYSTGNYISGQAAYNIATNPDHYRAATGDGILFQVWVHDVKGETRIHSIEPFLVTNFKDGENGMVVRTFDDLFADPDIPKEWRQFYTRREFLMRRLTADPTIPNLMK